MVTNEELAALADPSEWEGVTDSRGALMDLEYQAKAEREVRFLVMCDYLLALFAFYEGQGYVELRAIRADRREKNTPIHWIPTRALYGEGHKDRLKAVFRWAHEHEAAGREIYCGVLPRGRTRGRKQDIYEAGCLWADLDFKITDEITAMKAVEEADPEPDMVVLSGRGVHAYWWMSQNVSLTDDHIKAFECALAAKQQAILPGADGTFNIDRILRLPGFRNKKNPDDPRPVLLARCWRPMRQE